MGKLFNRIESDLKKGLDAEKAFAKEPSPEKLYTQLFFATKALLIVKGLEATAEAEVFDLFRDNFVATNIVSKKYLDLMALGRISASSRSIPQNNKEIINSFCNDIFQLYQDMDDDLSFPGEKKKAEVKPDLEKTENHKENKISKSVDYRGVACPLNYVKAKLVLETMSVGEKLEIILDDNEAIGNVPRSLTADGQLIESQTKKDGYWMVVVKKQK